jgi:site-specific recombinase XerD
LLHDYVDYLRGERGLAENSIHVYAPYIRDFLNERSARCGCVTPEQFDAPTVHAFVIEHIQGRGMELEDIRWRSAEMIIRGKGGRRDRMPLLSDIGEALAAYLHQDRGPSPSRRVFLRIWAPRLDLTGPAAVGHIVRRALARAEISRSGRGAAHLFRHGLATRMIRHGASIPEISEVLRHRSQGSSEIYAKVAFETLRAVARRWPATGGAR